MAKSEIHTLQIDSSLKEQAEALFSSLGMTLEEAVTLFLEASILHGGFPFPVDQTRYNPRNRTGPSRSTRHSFWKASTLFYFCR